MPVLNHAARTGWRWQGLDFHNPPWRRLWKTLSQTFSFGATIRVIGTSRPIANCPLTISTSAINNTGGHYHNTNRPKSQLSTSISGPWSNNSLTNVYTGPNGSTTIYSKASSIGQREQLVVCPQRPEGICTTASVNVRYNDIYYVEEKSEWIHVGGRSEHGGNDYSHWMTLGRENCGQRYGATVRRGFRYPFQLGTTS